MRVSKGTLELPKPLGPEPPVWMDGYARKVYEAFRHSGQAVYFAPSDWVTLALICRHIMASMRKPSAMMLSAILSGLASLGATEGDRRRIKIELTSEEGERSPEENAAAADIGDFLDNVAYLPTAT